VTGVMTDRLAAGLRIRQWWERMGEQRHHSACVCLGGRDLVGPGSVPFRYAELPSSPMASHSQGNVGPPNIDSTTQTIVSKPTE